MKLLVVKLHLTVSQIIFFIFIHYALFNTRTCNVVILRVVHLIPVFFVSCRCMSTPELAIVRVVSNLSLLLMWIKPMSKSIDTNTTIHRTRLLTVPIFVPHASHPVLRDAHKGSRVVVNSVVPGVLRRRRRVQVFPRPIP